MWYNVMGDERWQNHTRYPKVKSQLQEIEAARKKNRNKNVERRLYVLVMRAEGKNLEEISEKTGYHISTASKLIARYMRKRQTSRQLVPIVKPCENTPKI